MFSGCRCVDTNFITKSVAFLADTGALVASAVGTTEITFVCLTIAIIIDTVTSFFGWLWSITGYPLTFFATLLAGATRCFARTFEAIVDFAVAIIVEVIALLCATLLFVLRKDVRFDLLRRSLFDDFRGGFFLGRSVFDYL